MAEFLVEVYISRAAAAVAMPRPEDVSAAADQMSCGGRQLRFVRSIFVPEDETCFYLFEATSSDVVREAAARAGLRFDRVVEAMSAAPAQPSGSDHSSRSKSARVGYQPATKRRVPADAYMKLRSRQPAGL